jgi:hypothetical protein
MREAGNLVARFEAAARARAQDGRGDGTERAQSARLRRMSTACRSELEDARWRLLKGDTLGADSRLEHAVAVAREGLRSLEA